MTFADKFVVNTPKRVRKLEYKKPPPMLLSRGWGNEISLSHSFQN